MNNCQYIFLFFIIFYFIYTSCNLFYFPFYFIELYVIVTALTHQVSGLSRLSDRSWLVLYVVSVCAHTDFYLYIH